MGILARLFGYKGKVRFEGETVDGRKFTGSMHIESIGMDKADLEREIKSILYVEKGYKAHRLRIVACT